MRRKLGLTPERRRKLDARLSALVEEMGTLLVELSAVYPNNGPVVKATAKILKYLKDLRFSL